MKPQTNTDEHRDSRAATKLICLAFSLRPSRLRARQKIRGAFWRERRAGRCKAPRRRRCGGIVEERQRRRCPPAAAPFGLRPAGPLAVLLAPYIPQRSQRVCSSLAPCRRAWGPAAKCTPYFLTGPKFIYRIVGRSGGCWYPVLRLVNPVILSNHG